MGRSAAVLGRELGKTAQATNQLLKAHGYLEGEPGAYGLTEKGMQYGEEEDHTRGTGGYSWYNRSWTTRTWNDDTLDALRADMEANPNPVQPEPEDDQPEVIDEPADLPFILTDQEDPELDWKTILILGGAIGGGLLALKYGRRWVDDSVKPALQRRRDRRSKRPTETIGEPDQEPI